MIRRLAKVSTRRPARVLTIATTLTLAAAFGLPRLQFRTDGQALVPDSSAEVSADHEIRGRFGIRDPIAVVIRTDRAQGIFDPARLRRVQELTAALRRLEGVRPHDVTSLATERGFRRESGLMDFRHLLDPFPETPEALEVLRSDLRRIEVYDGILVSHDGSSAAILFDAPPAIDRAELVSRLGRIVATAGDIGALSHDETVSVIGAPVAEALLGRHILADLGVPVALLGETGHRGVAGTASGSRASPVRRFGMVPVAVAMMGLVFLVAFRRWAAAILPLVEVGTCLAIVFGLMGWLGVPIYLTTAVLPVILATIGVADEIHVFRRYLESGPHPGQTDREHRRVVDAAVGEMVAPVVSTSITTAVAFLSFTVSPLGPVRVFGLFTAVGVIVCMVFSLTVIPALLVALGPKRWVRQRAITPSRSDRGALSGLFVRVARLGCRHRRAVLVAAALFAVLSLDGVRRVKVQDSWLDGFAPDSAFARDARFFDRQFLGSHRLLVEINVDTESLEGQIDARALGRHELHLPRPPFPADRLDGSWIRIFQLGAPGSEADPSPRRREWTTWIDGVDPEGEGLLVSMAASGGSARSWLHPKPDERLGYEIWSEPLIAPPTLRRVDELERFLAGLEGVGGVLGPATYLKTVNFMLKPESEQARRLPGDPSEARVLWSNYGMVRGAERRAQLLAPDGHAAVVTVFLEGADFVETGRLLEEIREFERNHLRAAGIRLRLGGDLAVSQALIDAVVTTQVRSVLLSLVGILVVASLLSRSLRWGFYSVLPPAFAVLANFALMGWMGIPLGVATSMFACMTLGVGVDYAIHLLARYRLARRQESMHPEPHQSITSALSTAGPAILIDAVAVGVGFGSLVLSQVPANARLGVLLLVSIIGCLATSVLLIPALLSRPDRNSFLL